MPFDYVLNLYGKYRKKETRFTPLETKAVSLLVSFVSRAISDKDFAIAFDEVRKEFKELTEIDSKVVFDEDTPLWLNSLLGFHFMDWRRVQQLKWYFEGHPDELVGEMKERFEGILKKGHDQRFRHTCKEVLNELSGADDDEIIFDE